MKKRNDNIGLAILHYLERQLTGHELQRFKQWLGASDDNRLEYEQVKSIYDERDPHMDVGTGWTRLSMKMDRHDRDKRKVKRLKWVSGIAAALCLLLAAGLFIVKHSPAPPTTLTYVTGNTPSQLSLPDGSAVRLASNSRLVYHSDYGEDTRRVILDGEAFFVVKKDAKHPFLVQSQEQTIVVTGTEFNVCSYPGEHESTTTLKQGSIRFKSPTFKREIDLHPGEMIRFNRQDGSITVCQASLETELAWLENKHVFTDAPLSEILAKMGHVYNCRFTCDDPDTSQMRYTGTFYDTDSLTVFLRVIKTLTGLNATKNADGTIVTLTNQPNKKTS
ncbi:MAG: FecR domain-containing protein [Muribaculaceae bacterium]|nr:FecR domain-containing protein [Muribaculaceae bacterium]